MNWKRLLTPKLAWTAAGAAALVGLLGTALAMYLVFSGPRMRTQPHVRAFERAAPLPVPGTEPVRTTPGLPSPEQAALLAAPEPDSPETRERGRIYYGYYCVFCHGAAGRGDGPVGDSYVPVPSDLASDKIRSMTDGRLLLAMLTGVGHAPVLERVVPWAHRWPLVRYVRALAAERSAP